jgi:hypothetical protein
MKKSDELDRGRYAGWADYMRRYPYHFRMLYGELPSGEALRREFAKLQVVIRCDEIREHWEQAVCPVCGTAHKIRTTAVGVQHVRCPACQNAYSHREWGICPIADAHHIGWK